VTSVGAEISGKLLPPEVPQTSDYPSGSTGCFFMTPDRTTAEASASESTPALRALRAQAGPTVLIMTDDLSMAAASTALGITPAQAAVKSLTAGADVAMVCWDPLDGVLSAVTLAINNGSLPRAQAVASARRVLHVKDQVTATR